MDVRELSSTMRPAIRIFGIAIAGAWAIGITLALLRVLDVLEGIERSTSAPVPVVTRPAELPEQTPISIELRREPEAVDPPDSEEEEDDATPPSPEAREAALVANNVLAEIVRRGAVDDETSEDMRAALRQMTPEDRTEV